MRILFSLILTCSVFLGGCSNVYKKQNEVLRAGIYGVKESISKGRYDIAKKISEETARVVPPPKKPIIIKEFAVPENSKVINLDGSVKTVGGNVIVLPEGLDPSNTISFNSEPYKNLIKENADLKKTEEINQKSLEVYGKEVNRVLVLKEEELMKEKKSSWFGWIFGFGAIGTILILITCCVFFPALIPILGNIFSSFIGGVNTFIKFVGNILKKKESG